MKGEGEEDSGEEREERSRSAWRPLRLELGRFGFFRILGVATCGQKSIVMALGLNLMDGKAREIFFVWQGFLGGLCDEILGRVVVCGPLN